MELDLDALQELPADEELAGIGACQISCYRSWDYCQKTCAFTGT